MKPNQPTNIEETYHQNSPKPPPLPCLAIGTMQYSLTHSEEVCLQIFFVFFQKAQILDSSIQSKFFQFSKIKSM